MVTDKLIQIYGKENILPGTWFLFCFVVLFCFWFFVVVFVLFCFWFFVVVFVLFCFSNLTPGLTLSCLQTCTLPLDTHDTQDQSYRAYELPYGRHFIRLVFIVIQWSILYGNPAVQESASSVFVFANPSHYIVCFNSFSWARLTTKNSLSALHHCSLNCISFSVLSIITYKHNYFTPVIKIFEMPHYVAYMYF